MEVSPLALVKLISHSAQHSSRSVIGVLLGTESVSDSVPLFHTPVLTASLEVALQIVGQSPIAGFYEGRSCSEASTPSHLITQLAHALAKKGVKRPVVLCVDASSSRLIAPYRLEGAVLRPLADTEVSLPALQGEQTLVYDFDDHFDDPSKDWRNPQVSRSL
jgi:hypothetical protein